MNKYWQVQPELGEEFLGKITDDVRVWERNKDQLSGLIDSAATLQADGQQAVQRTAQEILECGEIEDIPTHAYWLPRETRHEIITAALSTAVLGQMEGLKDGTQIETRKMRAKVTVEEPGVKVTRFFGDPYHGRFFVKHSSPDVGETFEGRLMSGSTEPSMGGKLELESGFIGRAISGLIDTESLEPRVSLEISKKVPPSADEAWLFDSW